MIAKAKAFVTAYNGTVDALRATIGDRPAAAGTGPVAKGAFYSDDLYTDILARASRTPCTIPCPDSPASHNQAATISLGE